MKNNRFTGNHSQRLINFDYVIYAEGGCYGGSEIKVYLTNGQFLVLYGQDAEMFTRQWRGDDLTSDEKSV